MDLFKTRKCKQEKKDATALSTKQYPNLKNLLFLQII